MKRRTCPICRVPKALRTRQGIGGHWLLCIRGCDRQAIVDALAGHPVTPRAAWVRSQTDNPTPLYRKAPHGT
jgi:hypothetical protein